MLKQKRLLRSGKFEDLEKMGFERLRTGAELKISTNNKVKVFGMV